VAVAFPPERISKGFAEVISNMGLTQLHVAETEKYAHVTFFFNGTREEPFPGEERALIPSPKVAGYDETPAMSVEPLTEQLIEAVHGKKFDVIIANIANPDMVGHTGNMVATVKGMEVMDACLGRIVPAVLEEGGLLAITADHGNAEEMQNLKTHAMDKEHSTNPVPFVLVAEWLKGKVSASGEVPDGDLSLVPPIGVLADVAPTLLTLLGIDPPSDMTGQSLWSPLA
jgi:2,3-bisphosphoglycerate-independent phosphoglycerate mutase